MNPFDQYEQEYFQRRQQQRSQPMPQSGGGMGYGGGLPFGPQTAMAAPTTPAPQQKKKPFWVDQISTAGGMVGGAVGGLAGGIGGAGIGAIPGMAAGGAIGSGLGELLENVLTGEDDKFKNVVKEGAIGGVFGAGPLRLGKTVLAAKAAKGAAKAAGTEMGLKQAVSLGSDEAMKMSLRKGAGKVLTGKANDFATKQFGLTDGFVAKYGRRHGEDAGKTITKYKVNTAEDVEKAIAGQKEMFDSLITQAKPVDVSVIRNKLTAIGEDLLTQGPSQQKALGEKLLGEMDQLLTHFGTGKVPATAINTMRQQYDELVNYTMKQADPATYGLNKRVADALREAVQEASGSKQLKGVGKELSKLYDLGDEIVARAPQVASRGASPLNLRNLVGATVGGAAGGIPGAIGTGIAVAAANSPTARRLYTKGALKAGGALTDWGASVGERNLMRPSILKDQGIRGLARGAMFGEGPNDPNATGQPTGLEDAVLGGPMNASAMGGQFPGGIAMDTGRETLYEDGSTGYPMGGMVGGMPQEVPQSSNPYSREALMYDINRDPTNANKYIEYYQQLAEIFEPEMEEPQELNATQQQRAVAAQNALRDFPLLEEAITDGGALSGLKALPGANTAIGSRLLGTENIDSALFNVADNVLRARSGASAPAAEVRNFVSNFLPRPTDSPAAKREKLLRAKRELEGYYNPYGSLGSGYASRPDTIEETLMQRGAY